MNDQEKLPTHDMITVIDYETIYKTKKWWKAVALVNKFGHDEVVIYLWMWDDKKGRWTRRQKLGTKNSDEWDKINSAVEGFLPRIRTMGTN